MRGGGAEIERARVERSQRRADRRDVLRRFLESPGPLRGARPFRTDGSREGRSRDGTCFARSGPALQPVAAALFGGAQRPLRAAALSHQGRDQGRFRRCSGRGCADHRAGSRRRRRPAGDADVVQRSDCNVSRLGGEARHADPRPAVGERLTGGRRPDIARQRLRRPPIAFLPRKRACMFSSRPRAGPAVSPRAYVSTRSRSASFPPPKSAARSSPH